LNNKQIAFLKFIRPINCLITFITVIVAAVICHPLEFSLVKILSAALAAGLTAAAGNIINDIYDIEIDRINRPSRPLPSGLIRIKSAATFYFILVLISLVISLLVSLLAFTIVLISHLILFLYSKYLKKVPLIGNITVAFLTGLVFIFGGVSVKHPMVAIIPAAFAFLINFIREIVKDIQDVEGDSKAGVKTFPIQSGFKSARMFILILTLLLILFTYFPFFTKIYKIDFFIIVIVVVNPILVYCLKILFENQSAKNLKKISNLLKLDMVFGLLAIYLGVY